MREMSEMSERIARLDLARQLNIARSYPRFGTVANAVRIRDTRPKRKVMK